MCSCVQQVMKILSLNLALSLSLSAASDRPATVTYSDQGKTVFQMSYCETDPTVVADMCPVITYPIEGAVGVLLQTRRQHGGRRADKREVFARKLVQKVNDQVQLLWGLGIQPTAQSVLPVALGAVNQEYPWAHWSGLAVSRMAVVAYYTKQLSEGSAQEVKIATYVERSPDCETVLPIYGIAGRHTELPWKKEAVMYLDPSYPSLGSVILY